MLDNEDKVSLLSGETYILYNNLRGKIVIWINCDKGTSVKIDAIEFRTLAYSLFPNLNINLLLRYLNKGNYIFTDKMHIKELHPTLPKNENPIPSLKELGFRFS